MKTSQAKECRKLQSFRITHHRLIWAVRPSFANRCWCLWSRHRKHWCSLNRIAPKSSMSRCWSRSESKRSQKDSLIEVPNSSEVFTQYCGQGTVSNTQWQMRQSSILIVNHTTLDSNCELPVPTLKRPLAKLPNSISKSRKFFDFLKGYL